MLSVLTLSPIATRYSELIRSFYLRVSCTTIGIGAGVQEMAHPSRVKSRISGGIPHMPFQEFTADSLEQLLSQIKKARIPESQIEVTSSEDGKHYTCSTPITNVLLYTSQNLGDDQEYKDLIALYQYCPGCKNAVRVL